MCNILIPLLAGQQNGRKYNSVPERDLRCILLATLLLAGDGLGATICADLAVCPAAFGDIGSLLVKRHCIVSCKNNVNSSADMN